MPGIADERKPWRTRSWQAHIWQAHFWKIKNWLLLLVQWRLQQYGERGSPLGSKRRFGRRLRLHAVLVPAEHRRG